MSSACVTAIVYTIVQFLPCDFLVVQCNVTLVTFDNYTTFLRCEFIFFTTQTPNVYIEFSVCCALVSKTFLLVSWAVSCQARRLLKYRYKIFCICNWKTTSPGNNSFTEKENVQWHWQQYWDAHNKSDLFRNTFIFTSPGRGSNHWLISDADYVCLVWDMGKMDYFRLMIYGHQDKTNHL